MVQTCCISSCKTRKTPGDKLSFHFPPRDGEIRKKWAEVIGRELSPHMKVCGKHFSPDCYKESQWRSYKYLKDDAVPILEATYSLSPSQSLEDLSKTSTPRETNHIETFMKTKQNIILPCEEEMAKQGTMLGYIPIEIKTEIDQTSESSFQESPFEFVSTDNLEKTDEPVRKPMQVALLEMKLKEKELAEKKLLDNQLEYKRKMIRIFQNKNRTIKSLRQKNRRLEERVTRITKLLEVEKREKEKLELREKQMKNTNEDGSKKKRRNFGWRRLEAALKEEMSDAESEVDELELELEKLYQ